MKIEALLEGREPDAIKSISPDATLIETAKVLMTHQVGALLVLESGKRLVGIVSERDLVPVIASDAPQALDRQVSDIMTRRVISCSSADDIGYVLRLMNTRAIRHIPIIDDGRLIDMISIRELTRAYEMLQVVANTDPLTEVSNRRPFMERVEKEFMNARAFGAPLSMAMLDLDHFKAVNDTFGHDAGDAVLRAVSDILILEFRSIDLIGRLGGEEFAVLFPGTDIDGAVVASERVRERIAMKPIFVDGKEIRVTTSIGVATITDDTVDENAVLKSADRALYQAKSEGRNRVVQELPPLERAG